MHLIEPCCSQKHLRELRDSIAKGGTKQFEGYGDLSLTELLPALLMRYSETEMMIVAPSLPDQAAEVIDRWMRKQWARMDGKGKLDVVRHLTIVAKLEKEKSDHIGRWLKDNPFGGRLTLVDREQEETAILLPDFAITGPVNMRYGNHFVATATTDPAKVAELWEKFTKTAATESTDGTEHKEPEAREAPKPRRARKKGANSEGVLASLDGSKR